jgi:Rad3-related DNA helicase
MSIRKDVNKYTARPEQNLALDYIKRVLKEKPDNKFFLLNMPVGIGKSHLAVMISDYFTTKVMPGAQVDIITAGKLLQDQYEGTYEYINSLKGKDNYKCIQYASSCASGKEFNKLNKSKCEFCPYDSARTGYIAGEVSLTNFHLYLINAIYGKGGMMKEREVNARLLIVDEAHEFDDVMSDFISIKITESISRKFKFSHEDAIIRQQRNVVNLETYIEFLRYFVDQINITVTEIDSYMASSRVGDKQSAKRDSREMKINAILDFKSNDVKTMQLITELNQYAMKIDVFLNEYDDNPTNWVVESSYNEKSKLNELSLEPIWAHEYLKKFIWSKYDMVVLMSGTILDKKLFSEINGIDVEKSVYYSVPSPFALENRRIFYMPLGKMSYLKKEETFKKYIPFIQKILKKYSDVKGIIHTNSFELARWIENGITNDRLAFHESSNKEDVLRGHFDSDKPSVLVSPSVSTGVSFDHDFARFQILAKIPYPSLGSQKNKLRQKMNPDWYSWRTVVGIIQACGRPVRSATDYADTIIIDGSFSDVIRYSSDYFPKWFQESIKTVEANKK